MCVSAFSFVGKGFCRSERFYVVGVQYVEFVACKNRRIGELVHFLAECTVLRKSQIKAECGVFVAVLRSALM